MNQALFPASVSFPTRSFPSGPSGSFPARSSRSAERAAPSRATETAWTTHEENARLRRLRSLLGLFSLYAAALLVVVAVSDGADIGCMLGGIAGHVLYATLRIVSSWRDAAWLEDAKVRSVSRLRLRLAH
jgi:hypothetical protein